MQLADATRLGPYEILGPLGRGAMGEVYRAVDNRLNRPVALKIISPEAMSDARRQRRFEQEARSASALNHPNIVTIYEFGVESGTSYIVCELVDGESLREMIRRGPLAMRELIDLAIQMADGLAAAHSASIVHRDFKPENIMVTRDNRVKILDFGLAKPVPALLSGDTAASVEPAAATEPGMILGTVGYMSPEQAAGQEAGIQADQFSLGVILHEMATGQPAFKRETPLETLLAIAKVDQKPFTPGPSAFRLLVDRLLSKEPAQRFASTTEVVQRLRKIQGELPPVVDPLPAPATPAARPPLWRSLRRPKSLPRVTWPALVCGAAAALWLSQPVPPAQHATELEFTRLVDERPLQTWPTWSPDGRQVAYAADVRGQLQLFTQRREGGGPSQITSATQDCLYPFWSTAGNMIYYVQPNGVTRDLWRVGTWDGRAEMVQSNVVQADLAPDGTKLVMLRQDEQEPGRLSLWMASPPHAAPVRVHPAGWGERAFLSPSFVRVSPDSQIAAFWATSLTGAPELWWIPLNGREPRPLKAPSSLPHWFGWADTKTLLIAEDGRLFRWATGKQPPAAVTLAPSQVSAPAQSRTDGAIVFASGDATYRLASIPLGPSASTYAPAGLAGHSPAWSPTRPEIAYATERQGHPGIWLRNADGDERLAVNPSQFGAGATLWLGDLSFSPHGFRLLFRRVTAEGSALWIAPVHGQSGDPMPVAAGEQAPEPGSWSPDGNSIVYSALRQGRRTIMTLRLNGERSATALQAGSDPRWSPDGRTIAFRDSSGRAMTMSADGKDVNTVSPEAVLALAWDQNSRLWVVNEREGRLWLSTQGSPAVDLGPRSGATAVAAATAGRAIGGISISPDGRLVTLATFEMRTGLWTANGRQP